MNCTPDLFSPSDEPLQADLRASSSWRDVADPKRPEKLLEWVKESFCGRYTITWSIPPGADADTRIFLVWRRHPLVNGRNPIPSLLGRSTSAREARVKAAEHAESNP